MSLPPQDISTREDMGTLAVMEALVDQEEITQRELSRQTGMNLKKVNFCLHKLLEKGFIKFQRAIHNPDKRVYLYVLTPAGLREKSRLTYGFLKFTLAYYNRVEERLAERLTSMAAAGAGKVVLYGASDAARIVMGMVGNGIEVVAVLSEGHNASEFGGVPVVAPDALSLLEWDAILVTALDDLDEAEGRLAILGLPAEKVWRLT